MATQTNTSEGIGDQEVQMDRRRADRRQENDGEGSVTVAEGQKRRKQQRRRQIDPTTCERDYNNEEIKFMQALDAYKRSSGRMFPTCSEILEVIRDLGYVKLTEEEQQIFDSIHEVEADLLDATGEADPEFDSEADFEIEEDIL